jgi:tetratricopeptide (TPR) repeat protein
MSEQRGDILHARQVYQRSLQQWPGNAEILRAAARMEDRQGMLTVAENLYGQVVQANPQNAGALNDLGLCLARQGKLDASLTVIEQAIRVEPDKALFRNNAATVCVELRQDQRAMAHLAAVHGPADVQFNMGQLLVARGRNSEAERYFRMALDINPTMQEASIALGQVTGRMPVPTGNVAPGSQPKSAEVTAAAMPTGSESFGGSFAPEATTQFQAAPQGGPQAGPQLGPQNSYPSEARSNDGYGRSTYSPPSYTPPSMPAQPTGVPGVQAGGYAQGGISQGGVQGTVPWVGQATPRYLPPVGSVPPGARR